jgi:hypothetical protein
MWFLGPIRSKDRNQTLPAQSPALNHLPCGTRRSLGRSSQRRRSTRMSSVHWPAAPCRRPRRSTPRNEQWHRLVPGFAQLFDRVPRLALPGDGLGGVDAPGRIRLLSLIEPVTLLLDLSEAAELDNPKPGTRPIPSINRLLSDAERSATPRPRRAGTTPIKEWELN